MIKPLESRLVLSANVETFLSLSGGALLIEDVVSPDGKADTLTIQSDTTSADSADYKLVITDLNHRLEISAELQAGGAIVTDTDNGSRAEIPFTLVAGQIIANLGGDDDTLTLDFSLGSFTTGINFQGGDGEDTLAIRGTGLDAVYTPSALISGDGQLVIGESNISFQQSPVVFSSLAPIDYDVTGGSFSLDLTGTTTDEVTLEASELVSDSSLSAVKVSGTADGLAFENARVRGSDIFIMTNGGNDTVTVESVDADFAASLTIHGGGGNDTINIEGMVSAFLREPDCDW